MLAFGDFGATGVIGEFCTELCPLYVIIFNLFYPNKVNWVFCFLWVDLRLLSFKSFMFAKDFYLELESLLEILLLFSTYFITSNTKSYFNDYWKIVGCFRPSLIILVYKYLPK